MQRKGIADPVLREKLTRLAVEMYRIRFPELTPEEIVGMVPNLQDTVENIYQQIRDAQRETVEMILDTMDKVGHYPKLREKLEELRKNLS